MSGRPISEFWAQQQRRRRRGAALGCRLVEFAIEPPREVIHARIERRFATCWMPGLLDEVRALMAARRSVARNCLRCERSDIARYGNTSTARSTTKR